MTDAQAAAAEGARPLLLPNKLYRPALRPELVARPRLFARLDEGLRGGCALTLVAAPAGYGKSTLIAAWARRREQSEPTAVAWYTLDAHDNDPVRFFTYLAASLAEAAPDAAQSVARMLALLPQATPTLLVTTLLNELALRREDKALTPLLLVLDDYHRLQAPELHETVRLLVESGAPGIHVVLITRQDPPLPLSRWRVRDLLTEIRARDLRFTEEEATQFLQQRAGRVLEAQWVRALTQRTEGWVAGLQLAALALRGGRDAASFVLAFSGTHRYVIDYLVEEVLGQLAPPLHDFLRRTAVLDRLCAPLCAALMDPAGGDPHQAQQTLEYLEEANLFLIPLDGQRRWYRYHPLFADCLRAELPVQERTLGHRRAASWFSANGDYGEAISHAAAAGDEEEVADLVTLAAEPALQQGEVARLAGWMAQLPETRLLSDPRLAIYYLLCLILTGRSQEAPAALEPVEKGSGEWQDSRQRARLLALKAWVADITDSPARGKLAHEAAAAIGDDDPFFKALIAIPLGHAHTFEDRLGEAVKTFRAGLDAAQQPGVSFARLSLMSNVVHALNLQGRRLEALAVCRQALETFQDARGSPSPPAGLPMLLRGWLSYQAGDLDQAHLDLTQARELMKTAFGDTLLTPLQFELPALLQQAAGEGARALATARQGLQRAQQQRYRQAVRAATRLEADLQLRQGQLDPVRQWAADLPIRLGAQAEALWPAGEPVYDLAYLTFARLLIATDRHQDASRLLAELAAFARAGERGSSLITILLLQGLLVPDPEALLVEALQRADAEGYLQTVLDECTYPAHGAQLSALLQRTTVHRAAPAFVTQLSQRTGETPAKLSEATNEALPEPLTEQELIVLQHLVSGRSNREIAEELVITVGTAKWHVHNVYGKLGVGNRLDAVLRAQELGLV